MSAAAGSGDAFPAVDRATWRARVAAELGSEEAVRALAEETLEGLRIAPLYVEEDLPAGAPHPAGRRAAPAGAPPWWITPCVEAGAGPAVAAEAAGAEFAGGAHAVWLRSGGAGGGPADAAAWRALGEALAAGPAAPGRLLVEAGAGGAEAVAALRAGLGDAGAGGADGGAAVQPLFDPLGDLAAHGGVPGDLPTQWDAASGACVRGRQEGRPLVASALALAGAGGDAVQQLAWTLAATAEALRALEARGRAAGNVLAATAWRFAGETDVFSDCAKLRAARRLWQRLCAACSVTPAPQAWIHAVTGRRTLAQVDVPSNLLRVTHQACAAALGGADAITTLPHAGDPAGAQPAARRLARNLQHVLAEECALGAVADPAAGSYAFESHTDALARAAWARFRRWEAAGGLARMLADGLLQEEVEDAWQARRRRLVTVAEARVGVTLYPPAPSARAATAGIPAEEAPAEEAPAAGAADGGVVPLPARRDTGMFEALQRRAAALERAGRGVRARLQRVGAVPATEPVAERARQFAGAAGIPVHDADDPEAAAAGEQAGARPTLLCAAPDADPAEVAEQARRARAAGGGPCWFIGAREDAPAAELARARLADGWLPAGADLHAALDALLTALERAPAASPARGARGGGGA